MALLPGLQGNTGVFHLVIRSLNASAGSFAATLRNSDGMGRNNSVEVAEHTICCFCCHYTPAHQRLHPRAQNKGRELSAAPPIALGANSLVQGCICLEKTLQLLIVLPKISKRSDECPLTAQKHCLLHTMITVYCSAATFSAPNLASQTCI